MKSWHPRDTDHRSQAEFGKVIYDEVIKEDCYGLREFFRSDLAGQVKTVIDIGANVGAFSLMAAVLFPGSRRIAIEPGNLNAELLRENLSNLGTECVRYALGDGGKASMDYDPRWSGSDRCKADPNGVIQSRTFSALMRELGVPKKGLLVKIDCEGGEAHLVDDEAAKDWFDAAIWFGAEFHEDKPGNGQNTRDRWDTWFYQTFGEAFSKTRKELGQDMGRTLFSYRAVRKI